MTRALCDADLPARQSHRFKHSFMQKRGFFVGPLLLAWCFRGSNFPVMFCFFVHMPQFNPDWVAFTAQPTLFVPPGPLHVS
jgi:hypothetical protein